MNAAMSPEAVLAYGWRIPFILGLGVGLGGIAIRRYYVERVPHQAPARSPLGEAFGLHWRTMLHLVALVAGLSMGFYTTFVYAATWLAQVAQVPARTALGINTLAMGLSLIAAPAAGLASDRVGRRSSRRCCCRRWRLTGLPRSSRRRGFDDREIADFICDYLDRPGVRITRHPTADGPSST